MSEVTNTQKKSECERERERERDGGREGGRGKDGLDCHFMLFNLVVNFIRPQERVKCSLKKDIHICREAFVIDALIKHFTFLQMTFYFHFLLFFYSSFSFLKVVEIMLAGAFAKRTLKTCSFTNEMSFFCHMVTS